MSPKLPRVTTAERRARLAVRHRLAPAARARSAVEAAEAVVALHATDSASVHLSACARMKEPSIAAVEAALYDDRSLVRMLGMRRTMFVVPVDLAPGVKAAAPAVIAERERGRLATVVERSGLAPDGEAWLAATRAEVLAALAARGEATGAELGKAVPALQVKVAFDEGKAWGREITLTTQVLNGLSADGAIVRGRPRGSWVSSQYRWAATDDWLAGGIPELPQAEARAELVRRYLAAYGPASVTDVRWWTGWMKGATTALAALDVVEVELDDGPGIALARDLGRTTSPPPWAALLPALDPTMMGWSERAWYLGDHRPALFDRSGNAGPTVWWDGRVVGGWAQRPDGEVVFRLLEDVGAEATAAVEAEAARVTAITGGVRATPKFRTPLERELST